MHAAFGSFFDYDGGKYGMARAWLYPIRKVENLRLPGNEPRTALVVEVVLPNDQSMLVINVHLDWVKDDKFRLHKQPTCEIT